MEARLHRSLVSTTPKYCYFKQFIMQVIKYEHFEVFPAKYFFKKTNFSLIWPTFAISQSTSENRQLLGISVTGFKISFRCTNHIQTQVYITVHIQYIYSYCESTKYVKKTSVNAYFHPNFINLFKKDVHYFIDL